MVDRARAEATTVVRQRLDCPAKRSFVIGLCLTGGNVMDFEFRLKMPGRFKGRAHGTVTKYGPFASVEAGMKASPGFCTNCVWPFYLQTREVGTRTWRTI